MSGLIINTKKLGEMFKEWRGNDSCYDCGKPVFDADELLDFAEFCLTHKANEAPKKVANAMIEDKLKIVQHYMNHQNEYRLDNGEWWKNLKKLKLSDKTEEYINQVSDLIDEWIDNGKDAFYKKYKLT